MGRMKRSMAVLLVLVMCFSAALPYAGGVSAADAEADTKESRRAEYVVTLESAQEGRIKFADSEEAAMAYHEGDRVTLEISPGEGYELMEILLLNTADGTKPVKHVRPENLEGKTGPELSGR